ncbi:hypothetical protein SmJEL517_g01380 [Synchytrium microbalum]|uniref:Alpha/beta hydrolase fold-3 domain-containing protein n=1 Tax=Synchytrium microbalum TaxID=1806994 RepID=A0A507CBZ2_9FUNG|nr:uncharacterized protein SmJEL517_g01380 [Synchytrium microbalum]TPX36689.1 hypothetical protein SmJEL517_g01380 [Synchytrium microbalum]
MTADELVLPESWSPELKAAVTAFKQGLGIKDLAVLRQVLSMAPVYPTPEGITVTDVKIPRLACSLEESASGEIDAEWVVPTGKEQDESLPIVLYFHGGGYAIMSPKSHRYITTTLASSGLRVLSVDYRMGPEAPYPAAVVDAFSSFKYLLSQGYDAKIITFSGDSAGGGLSLATALYLRDKNETFPSGLAPLTPWIDLRGNTPSDLLLEEFMSDIISPSSAGGLDMMVGAYANKKGSEAVDPYISPVIDTPTSVRLPPAFVTTGTVDRLMSEDLADTLKRTAAGDVVQLYLYEDQVHAFQGIPVAKASVHALKKEAEFVKDVATGAKLSTKFVFVSNAFKEREMSLDEVKSTLKKLIERAEAMDGNKADFTQYKSLCA